MRIVRFVSATTTSPSYGVVDGDQIRAAKGSPFEGEFKLGDELTALAEATLLAPCEPTKIVAGGISYRSHANEMKLQIPDEPVFFLKPSTCMTGHNAVIDYPRQSERMEYEAELAAIIKTKTYKASPEEAKANILGYACANDVTARDIQARGGNMIQLSHSKAFDTFCPVGPWIETELDANNVEVSLTVNGETRQHGNTSDMIFTVEEMVSFFSHIMTLLPGDVVLTGTPYGVGEIKSGDVVDVTVQGIGTLSNTVGFKS